MNNIITGGTGLVGSRLVFDLVANNQTVSIIKRKETDIQKLINNLSYYSTEPNEIVNKIKVIEGDISDFEFLLDTIPEGSNVYHCAAKVSFSKNDEHEIRETNIEGTQNLINVCLEKKVNKFCFVSSIASLGGKIKGQLIDENTPWSASGKSPYALSKYESEMEVWKGVSEGLNAVIVNPGVILGPGDWHSGSSQIFSTVKKGLLFYTKGITGYVDVKDVSKAMILLMNSDITGERFILSSASISYEALFAKISKALGVKAPKFYASKFVTTIGWISSTFFSVFLKSKPKLTKHTHLAAHKESLYNGNKICNTVAFNYAPINDTINFVAEKYLLNQS